MLANQAATSTHTPTKEKNKKSIDYSPKMYNFAGK